MPPFVSIWFNVNTEHCASSACWPLAVALAVNPADPKTKKATEYRRSYNLVLNGTIPAENVRGRWWVQRSDLPKVASLLGVEIKQAAGRTRRAPSSNSEAVAAA